MGAGVKFSDYLKLSGLNWSRLKHMRTSPAAYIWHAENGGADSDDLALGRLTHTLLFEPQHFDDDYAVWHGRRQGKDWEGFEASNAAKTIITAKDYGRALAMSEAVRSSSVAAPYLEGAELEATLQWTDPATGMPCKGRADILRAADRVLADLKTCASIDARRFGAAAFRLGYPGQFAHYGAGVRHSRGWTPAKSVVIAVEKVPPHEVAVFPFAPEQLDTAAEEVAMLMQRVQECTASGVWPGRYVDEVPLQLPTYVDGEIEVEFIEEE